MKKSFLAAIGLVALAPLSSLGEEPLGTIHTDVPALERAASEALLGYARDQAGRVEQALDVVAEQVRVLKVEDRALWGKVVGYSRSFEISNNLAREYADGEMLDESYDQFVWVMKGCRTCHTIAIAEGIPVHPVRE